MAFKPLALTNSGGGAQLRLAFDSSNYANFTVNSGGDLTIAPTGSDTSITGRLGLTGALTFSGSAASGTASAVYISQRGSPDEIEINVPTGGTHRLRQNGSDVVTFSGGNIGVVTTLKSWASGYRAMEFAFGGLMMAHTSVGNSEGTALTRNAYFDGSWKYIATDEAQKITLNASGEVVVSVAASGTANTAITWTNVVTMNNAGTIVTRAGTTAAASLRVPHGSAPTSPTNGDMWTTTAGLFVRINGSTVGPLS